MLREFSWRNVPLWHKRKKDLVYWISVEAWWPCLRTYLTDECDRDRRKWTRTQWPLFQNFTSNLSMWILRPTKIREFHRVIRLTYPHLGNAPIMLAPIKKYRVVQSNWGYAKNIDFIISYKKIFRALIPHRTLKWGSPYLSDQILENFQLYRKNYQSKWWITWRNSSYLSWHYKPLFALQELMHSIRSGKSAYGILHWILRGEFDWKLQWSWTFSL